MSWLNKFDNLFGKKPKPESLETRLLRDRIVFLGSPIDDETATHVIAQLLFLEDANSNADISLYINSPGGSIAASMAIFDTIKSIKQDVVTVCTGQAVGSAALIAAGGKRGKRFALASAFFKFVEPEAGDAILTATDSGEIERHARELRHAEDVIFKTLSDLTKKPEAQLRRDHHRQLHLSAEEAIGYGLIDAIVKPEK